MPTVPFQSVVTLIQKDKKESKWLIVYGCFYGDIYIYIFVYSNFIFALSISNTLF